MLEECLEFPITICPSVLKNEGWNNHFRPRDLKKQLNEWDFSCGSSKDSQNFQLNTVLAPKIRFCKISRILMFSFFTFLSIFILTSFFDCSAAIFSVGYSVALRVVIASSGACFFFYLSTDGTKYKEAPSNNMVWVWCKYVYIIEASSPRNLPF